MEEVVNKARRNVLEMFQGLKPVLGESRVMLADFDVIIIPAGAMVENLFNIGELLGEQAAKQIGYIYGRGTGKVFCELVARYFKLDEPLLKGTHGPLVFIASGMGFVDRLRVDVNIAEGRFSLLWESPNSIFARYYLEHRPAGIKPPVCEFFAGFSAGWWEAASGIELQARELWCAAEGKPACRFIISTPKELYRETINPENLKPTEEYQVSRLRF